MMRIGILGANGQVGTEVCLLLKHLPNVEVVGICRRRHSGATLRHLGVACRVWDSSNDENSDQVFSDLDLIADFTLPAGTVKQCVATHEKIMQKSLAAANASIPYVYISSLMALGISDRRRYFRNYWIAGTTYGTIKRRAESMALRIGRQQQHPVYILRLGQVHGILQPVTLGLKRQIETSPKYRVPSGPSFTVFCYTIAEALANICAGRELPGRYTAVSNPAWSWKEFLAYLGATNVEELDLACGSVFSIATITSNVRRGVMTFAEPRKELIQCHLLCHTPAFEHRLRVRNWCNTAKASLTACRDTNVIDWQSFLGESPGQRLASISDSRESMDAVTNECIRDLGSRQHSAEKLH